MSDISTGNGAAGAAEPADERALSDVGTRDDAEWLEAFLLAHRGKTYRIDGGSGRGAGPASDRGEFVPTDVIDDVVRAVRQQSEVAPERLSAPEQLSAPDQLRG